MGYRKRHRATVQRDIMKDLYDDILISAKRKHSNSGEFYLFKATVSGKEWYSECSVDIYGDSIEHWIKSDSKWQKQMM